MAWWRKEISWEAGTPERNTSGKAIQEPWLNELSGEFEYTAHSFTQVLAVWSFDVLNIQVVENDLNQPIN